MHLKTNDSFEIAHTAAPSSMGLRARKFKVCSIVCAARKITLSSKGLPISCTPIGRPDAVNPQGTESAGTPAKLAGIVKISERYIASGSVSFSPILKGGVGVVGDKIKSAFSKAVLKSWRISVRT